MAANYTSNPTAIQAPSPAPAVNTLPIVSLPADTDGATWANLFQALKTPLDWIGWAFQVFGGTRTVKSLQVDAVGGNTVAGPPGNVDCDTLTTGDITCNTVTSSGAISAPKVTATTSGMSFSVPNGPMTAKSLYYGMIPVAGGNFVITGAVGTFDVGFGMLSFVRNDVGFIVITLTTPLVSKQRTILLCSTNGYASTGPIQGCTGAVINTTTIHIHTFRQVNDIGAVVPPHDYDLGFSFMLFGA